MEKTTSYEELIEKIKQLESDVSKYKSIGENLVDKIPYASWIKDTEGKFIYVNEYFASQLNLQTKDIIGKDSYSLFPPEEAMSREDEDKIVLSQKKSKSYEILNNGKWYEIYKAPLLNSKGEVLGIFGMTKDITSEKNKVYSLSREGEFLRALMDNIPDTIYFKDKQSRFTLINKAKAREIGLVSPDEAIGKTDFDFFDKEQAEQAFQDEQKIFATGIPLINKVEKLKHQDGEPYWVSATKIAIKDELNRITGLVGISRNITYNIQVNKKLREAKEKAEESDKLKTAFLANMSHEIRTPMNGIIGFSNLLKDPDISTEDRDEYISQINSCSNTLLNLIDDIIDISKIEAGQLRIMESETPVIHILKDLYSSFSKIKEQENKFDIDFNLKLPENIEEFTLITDPNRLKQILTNLLGNAFKFTGKGKIEFGLMPDITKTVVFYVKDTGIGIPEDKKDVIFDRFAQVFDPGFKGQKGTGLGLAICSNLAKLLGGSIRVESQYGKGSAFFLELPYNPGSKGKMVTVKNKLKPSFSWEGKQLLIVEDERINQIYLREILKKTGASISWASNGKEAIEMHSSMQDIDMILMDLKMPEIDGYQATRRIREKDSSVIIIAQTAYAMQDEREKCIQHGCNDYVSKPIQKDQLLELMNKYLTT